MDVFIAPRAKYDIAGILSWAEEHFGPQITKRYARLIAIAIEQIAENPDRAGSRRRPEIAENCRTYHLHYSRTASGRAADRIRQPRHLLLYRVKEPDKVEIGRVLHDAMDLHANLPEDYHSSSE